MNYLLFDRLSKPYCIAINVITCVLFLIGMVIHILMVEITQEYRVGDGLFSSFTSRICFRNRLKKPVVRRKLVSRTK